MTTVDSPVRPCETSHSVAAVLNYVAATDLRPEIWNEDFTKNMVPTEPTAVRILDGGKLAKPSSLDAEGFALISHSPELGDIIVSEDDASRYRALLLPMMLRLTGADSISVQPVSVVRRAVPVGGSGIDNTAPASFVHSDLSPLGADQVTGKAFAAPDRPPRRRAAYNMWRLLSKGPTDLPLAVCDARSVERGDIVLGDSKFETMDFQFETMLIRPNPKHRWIYFPDMTEADLLVFKQFDTELGEPQFVPHSAFVDASCLPGAVPRVSVECRCMAYWY